MQDTELFLSLAEIAGVFVGFAALISVRAGGASDAHEVAYIRSVVLMALWVVVVALAPIIVSRYEITGHGLWLACSLVALVLFAGMLVVNSRTPEMQEEFAASSRAQLMGQGFVNTFLYVPMLGGPILIVVGLLPDLEVALYLTAAAFGLFMGALTLFLLVFSQRRPQAASNPAALPAAGGSSG